MLPSEIWRVVINVLKCFSVFVCVCVCVRLQPPCVPLQSAKAIALSSGIAKLTEMPDERAIASIFSVVYADSPLVSDATGTRI